MNRGILILIMVIILPSAGVFAQMTMKKTSDGILITEDEKEVLHYVTVPKNLNGKYQRLNYIHPLYSLHGKVLTEDFPADHPFHRGIFWAWRQIWIGDQRIGDGWEIDHFEQTISEFEFIKTGAGLIVLKTEVDWMSDLWVNGGIMQPYLKEKGTVTIHPRDGNMRRIDFEINLLALTEGVKLGGSEDHKGYGGFSVRLDLPKQVKFTGPDGQLTPQDTALDGTGYVNISGKFESGNHDGGVVIIDHPENPGYPQPWILREKNSMQNAAWPGREAVKISMTDPTILKYTLVVYSGKLSKRKIERMLE